MREPALNVSKTEKMNMKNDKQYGFAAAMVAAAMAFAANAATYYVSPTGDDSSTTGSESAPYKTIKKGVGKLANGDTLIIKSGEYLMDVGVGCSGGTEESDRKTIKSETGSPADVVLYGCGTNELFRFAKFVTLSGVTLSNGVNSTSQPAGAVRFGTDNYPDYATIVSNCVVTCCTNTFTTSRNGAAVALFGHNLLVDCVIKGNTSTSGNGAGVIIVNNDTIVGVPKMKRCRIEGNVSAGGGGGVYVANNTLNSTKESNGNVVEIEDCEIVDNTSAASGGGVYCATNLTLNISRCVIAGNTTEGRGGGVFCGWNNRFYGNIANCVFTNNASRYQGGGLCIRENVAHPDDPATIRNCLFANNRTTYSGDTSDTSDSNGGGVCLVTVNDVLMENCTIVSNGIGVTKNNVSGGIHHRWGGKLKNCIVAFNTVGGEPESGNGWSLQESDTSYINCCGWPAVTHFTTSGSFNADPRFADAANGDFTLVAASPCVAAGATSDWMAGATDLAGNPRLTGGTVDIGCYEFGAKSFYVSPDGDDSNSGASAEAAFKTLEKGFETVNAKKGTTLNVADGTYEISETLVCRGGETNDLRTVIVGNTGDPESVVIDAKNADGAMRLARCVTLAGVTISNGVNSGSHPAAGIAFNAEKRKYYSIIVTNCVVTCCSNKLASGKNGAAVVLRGHNLLIDSEIRNNASNGDGAGVLLVNKTSGGVPRIENCHVFGNEAARGGGIFVANSIANDTGTSNLETVEIADCDIVANKASVLGAGIFCQTNLTVDISGCAISANEVAESGNGGGGMRCEAGAVSMTDCYVDANKAPCGAGVDLVAKSELTFNCEDTQFLANSANAGNSAGGGARVFNYTVGTARAFFDGCKFEDNSTTVSDLGGGAGIFCDMEDKNYPGYVSVSNCLFRNNRSACRGGGFANSFDEWFRGAIVNCAFVGNTSVRQGGGIFIREDTNTVGQANSEPATIRNCLVAFNETLNTDYRADSNGGGVSLVTWSDIVLENCTIVSNNMRNAEQDTSDREGGSTVRSGGIHHRWNGTLKNCIVAFNTVGGEPELGSGPVCWTWNDNSYINCCGWPAVEKFKTENGCIAADPKFADAAHGDFSLMSGSKCWNAGVTESWMADAIDLAGNARLVGGVVDIGCYELQNQNGCMLIFK